jgi:signal transduction histidine kinase
MSDAAIAAGLFESVQGALRREHEQVSRLLHDDIGQILTVAALELDLVQIDFAAANPELAGRIAGVQRTLEQAFEKVRSLAYAVHPNPVERFGLVAALRRLLERVRMEYAGQLETAIDESADPGGETAVAFYECGAAALDNAVRHSGGSRIRVSLGRHNNVSELTVEDNGAGFSAESAPAGLGFLTFRYYNDRRMVYLKRESRLGQGTRLVIRSVE